MRPLIPVSFIYNLWFNYRYSMFTCEQLMLETWNGSIFSDIKYRLQDCAMKLLQAERNGKVFDSQLVIGVRESYGMQNY